MGIKFYAEPPARYEIENFRALVRDKGTPESFPGLHPGPLDGKEQFTILCEFQVDRKKRADGNMVPCPMCHSPNKFLNGFLVYLPRLQVIAAIGHECADSDVVRAARWNYNAHRTKERDEDFLLKIIPHIPNRIDLIERMRPCAEEAMRIYKEFKLKAPTIYNQFKQVKKNYDRLILTEDVGELATTANASGGRAARFAQTRDISFGRLIGSGVFVTRFNPVAELDNMRGQLLPHNVGNTEEAALDYIVEFDDHIRRRIAVEAIRKSDKNYELFIAHMNLFTEFFRGRGLDRIQKWVEHPAHPDPFKIRIMKVDKRTIFSVSKTGEFYRASIDPIMFKYDIGWPDGDHD